VLGFVSDVNLLDEGVRGASFVERKQRMAVAVT
jgi:hypothetical protein